MTTGRDKVTRVWDVYEKKLVKTLSHDGIVSYARFTPDSWFVMTGSRDKTAGLWVATTGAKPANIPLSDSVR
ncbi:MAG: hypothetical protein VYD85_18555 [Pseudomonadota bacterium]|nr:hypothetical protein [Pseudomonadota bacterium]